MDVPQFLRKTETKNASSLSFLGKKSDRSKVNLRRGEVDLLPDIEKSIKTNYDRYWTVKIDCDTLRQ
jgi:hypothetical protein